MSIDLKKYGFKICFFSSSSFSAFKPITPPPPQEHFYPHQSILASLTLFLRLHG